MCRVVSLTLLAFALLTACASPPRDGGGARGGPPGSASQRGPGAGDAFSRAASLIDAGQYGEALPALRCLASQGPGYEVAQYLAGYSALRHADALDTPEVLRPELRVEALDRLTEAAEAGWPAAQALLAETLSVQDGPVALEEAGYWAAVYRSNRRDQMYGLDRLGNEIEADIASRLTNAQTAAIDTRAGAFSPTPLERVEAGPECQAVLRSGNGMRGQSGEMGSGGRRPRGGPSGGGGSMPGGSRPGG
jgi:hypothetical protein